MQTFREKTFANFANRESLMALGKIVDMLEEGKLLGRK